MEQRKECSALLELMARPAFCVENGIITRVNALAGDYQITPGSPIAGLLRTGEAEYAAFTGGCLSLTLDIGGRALGATVTRVEDYDVFCLEELADNRELQAMELAARELRKPLSAVMSTAAQLFPVAGLRDDPATRDQVARINRGLYQILRVIGNMSGAGQNAALTRMETVDITGVLNEIFEKAAALVAHTKVSLCYEGYPESIYCLADRQGLERAVLNMISNAIKFSKPGDCIRASLTRRGRMLYLTIRDNGQRIPDGIRGDVFTRYQRRCGIEDPRFGIGLGMVLVRAAAAAHGGTVLVDHPGDAGNRITMTLAIRQGSPTLRAGIFQVDYTGERDHCLVELADALPDPLYEQEY